MRDRSIGQVKCKNCGNAVWLTTFHCDEGPFFKVWQCTNCNEIRPYRTRKKHKDSKQSRLDYFLFDLSKTAAGVLRYWDYFHYDQLMEYVDLRMNGKLHQVKTWDINYHIQKLEEQIKQYDELVK